MKNIQNIIIGVLAAAVVGLYILQFTCKNEQECAPSVESVESVVEVEKVEDKIDFNPEILAQNTSSSNGGVYWVNIDELQNGYDFYDEMQRIGNKLQRKHERLITDKKMKAQKDYQDLMTLDQKGLLTPETAQIRQADLMKMQEEIQKMEQDAGRELAQKTEALNQKLYANISSFLNEYSQTIDCNYILGYAPGSPMVLYVNDSLDITGDVLIGLNKAYNKK